MDIVLRWEDFEKISEFIYRKTGITLSDEKHFNKIHKLINTRSAPLKIATFRQYFSILRFEDKNGDEFQELINAITVNETYFFRENYQFETLVNHTLKELHSRLPASRTLRILSAPTSTGEEPYSIAIYLLEEGRIINERDIEIVGIDIDSEAIKKAKVGLYTPRSIHAVPDNIKATYFKKKGMFFEFDPDIKDAVHLTTANVFNKNEMRKLGKFDVIFSRNMLIYFDEASQKEVAMNFYEMLNPGGYIFLGHAEHMSRIVSVFEPIKYGKTLVYKKN